MKVGDLVYEAESARYGIVERIDMSYYGSRQAYKIINPERGKVIRSNMVDYVPRPTEKGIYDRVMVCWADGSVEYLSSLELEVVS